MSYLYGDSTPSTLEVNFIEFLRDAVDCCVQVLLADQRIAEGKARTRALDQATAAEIVKLQKVGTLVPKAFEGVPFGEPETAAARCVGAIVHAAADLVRTATAEVRSARDAEVTKCDAEAAHEREACVKALEGLLIKHDLPDMTSDVHVALVGSGARYASRARVTTRFGLDAVVELEVPAGHLFERVVRVDRLAERLDVQVPEMGGWLHKEIKLKAQHLEKHHVTELSLGAAGGATVKLRAAPDGTGPGFDVLFSSGSSPLRLARVDQNDNEPFDVEEADVPKLRALREKLAAAAAELVRHRKAVVDPKIDGELLRDHAKPSLLVERLIATLAPVVQEIATRSQSPGELVLRRLIGGGRREEIFLSKQELKSKLDPLRDANRALFDPLWLEGVVPASSLSPPASSLSPPANSLSPPASSPPSASHAASTAGHPTMPPPLGYPTLQASHPTPPASHAAPPPPPPAKPAAAEAPPASLTAKPAAEPPPATLAAKPAAESPPATLVAKPAAESPASPAAKPAAESPYVSLATKPAALEPPPASPAVKPTAAEPPLAAPIPRSPTPRFGMSPLAMAIAEGAAAAPTPPPPAPRDETLRRTTTGSIELTKAPTPARLLDRPPPSAPRPEVEVNFEDKAPGPGGSPSRD
jgi:hypothetical protein